MIVPSLTIAVTGGAGFIGQRLSHSLLDLGHIVRIVDNDVRHCGDRVWPNTLSLRPVDIRNRHELAAAFRDCDVVVHLAAHTRVLESVKNPEHNFETNVVGTFNVLQAMKDCGVQYLINASTGGAIVGEVDPPVHENMAPHPISPYGASKLAAEAYVDAFSESYDIKACSLRFSNIYGPGSTHKDSVIARFCKQILAREPLEIYGAGHQTRDFLYIDDLCFGILQAMETGANGTFQLGTGTPTSVNQVIEMLRAIVPDSHRFEAQFSEAQHGEVTHTWCDISKASDTFGFLPKVALEVGLTKTWQWFYNNSQ